MKINDAIWGALFGFLAVALLVHIQSFPTIPGQKFGPALFPGVIAVGMAVCALLLIVKGFASRRRGGERAEWIAFNSWVVSPRHVIAFALVIGVNVFYIFAVNILGFVITGTIYLATLFAIFGVRARWILPIAVAVTLVIHYSFYKLLKVPLPWGLLQGIAW